MKKLTRKDFIKFLIKLVNKINLQILKYIYNIFLLAEAVGFEPTNDGVRAHCLTTWRCFHIHILEDIIVIFKKDYIISLIFNIIIPYFFYIL